MKPQNSQFVDLPKYAEVTDQYTTDRYPRQDRGGPEGHQDEVAKRDAKITGLEAQSQSYEPKSID